MAKARRNLASVLGADRIVGCERDGADGSRLTFVDVTAGGQVHKMLGSTGGRLARIVGACATCKPLVLGHADVWEGIAHNTASLQGVQHQLRPCMCTVCNQ